METKHLIAQVKVGGLNSDLPEGSVQAMISVFTEPDDGGDMVLPSFFTDGQPLAMSAWGHSSWATDSPNLPPGKGKISVKAEGAIFDGQFFLDTIGGEQHYKTVKNLGDLQEWSFGFRVLEAEPGEWQGRKVRFLKRGEIYEAAPVLIGMHRGTHTVAIKEGVTMHDTKQSQSLRGSYEARRDAIEEAINLKLESEADANAYPMGFVIATFDDYVICVTFEHFELKAHYQVGYSIDDAGVVTLGTWTEVEQVFVPVSSSSTFAANAHRLLAQAEAFAGRAQSLADLRSKDGRSLSDERKQMLRVLAERVTKAGKAMGDVAGPAPETPLGEDDLAGLLADIEVTEAKINGVLV